MLVCKACGSFNLESSHFCDECGESLEAYRAPDNKSATPENPSAGTVSENLNTEFETQIANRSQNAPIPDRIIEPKSDVGNDNAADKPKSASLIIERGGAIGTEFALASDVSNVGRWDADNGIFPDVDLDAHDPEAKVSRKHARIIVKDGSYFVEDRGSTNGTFINRGRRLIPGSPHPLEPNDEIIIGKTFLRFRIKE